MGFEVKFTKVEEVPEQIVCVKGVFVKTGTSFIAKASVAKIEFPHSLVTINETV